MDLELAGKRAIVTGGSLTGQDLREVDVPCVGDPQGPADGPAVAFVELGVVGLAGAVLLDGVEDGALEFRLVALDNRKWSDSRPPSSPGPAM